MPGTSQLSCAASIWFSSASGTVSVSPSKGCPGANRYSSGSAVPAVTIVSGYCASVTPAAACRISVSRVMYSSRGAAASAAPRQRSNVAVEWMPAGTRVA